MQAGDFLKILLATKVISSTSQSDGWQMDGGFGSMLCWQHGKPSCWSEFTQPATHAHMDISTLSWQHWPFQAYSQWPTSLHFISSAGLNTSYEAQAFLPFFLSSSFKAKDGEKLHPCTTEFKRCARSTTPPSYVVYFIQTYAWHCVGWWDGVFIHLSVWGRGVKGFCVSELWSCSS